MNDEYMENEMIITDIAMAKFKKNYEMSRREKDRFLCLVF